MVCTTDTIASLQLILLRVFFAILLEGECAASDVNDLNIMPIFVILNRPCRASRPIAPEHPISSQDI